MFCLRVSFLKGSINMYWAELNMLYRVILSPFSFLTCIQKDTLSVFTFAGVKCCWEPAYCILSAYCILRAALSTASSFRIWNSSTGILSLPGASVRNSAHDKGHEEGGSAYAKAGSSLRSPPGNSRASTPQIWVCLLSALCFHLHLWLYGGLSPTTSLWKKS